MAPISSSSPGYSSVNTSTQLFPRAGGSDGTGLSTAGTVVLVIGIISALAIIIIFLYILPRYSRSTIQWQLYRIKPNPNTSPEAAQTPEDPNADDCASQRVRTEFIFCSFRRKKPKCNKPPSPAPSVPILPVPATPPPSLKKSSRTSIASSTEHISSHSRSSKRAHSTDKRPHRPGRSTRSAWTTETYHRRRQQLEEDALTRKSAPWQAGAESEPGSENAPEERQSVELRQTANSGAGDGAAAPQMIDQPAASERWSGGWDWWRRELT